MIRNSVLYRRLWYVKKRNSRNFHIYSRLAAVIIIFILLAVYVEKQTFPYLAEISEFKTRENITAMVHGAVSTVSSETGNFKGLVIVTRSSTGDISSVEVSPSLSSRIANKASLYIQQRMSALSEEKLALPMGVLTGKSIFSSLGPNIHLSYKSYGDVETSIRSSFSPSGNHQTHIRVLLHIRIKMVVCIPAIRKEVDMESDVPLVDAVLSEPAASSP